MGVMYDRSHDGGRGQVPMTEIPLDGSSVHVTQYDALNNERRSWDADGSLNSATNFHYTNQNVGKHHPNRH